MELEEEYRGVRVRKKALDRIAHPFNMKEVPAEIRRFGMA